MKFRELIAYDKDEKKEWEISDRAFALLIFGVWVVAVNLLAVIYIAKSRYIYYWDSANYWEIAGRVADGAVWPDFFGRVYESICTTDYNYLAALPSALVMKVFGNSRFAYVLSILNFYIVPSMALIYFIAKRIGKAPLMTLSIVMFICPSMLFAAFMGFADAGGLLGALLCFYLYFCGGDKKNVSVWRCLTIGVLLVVLMLWRRWYAFFAVSFVTAMIADSIISRRSICPAIICAATAAAILALLLRDFLFNMLISGYGGRYMSYRFSVSADLKLMARYFGVIYVVLLAAATVYGAVKRKNLRPIFMWVQMIVCAVMFMLLQPHGQQQLLLYIPSLIMLTIYAVRFVDKEWMLVLICAAALVNGVSVYMPYKQPESAAEIKYYAPIPAFSLRPRIRDDAYDILNLKIKLDSTIGAGETLGVLASSQEMNEDVLKNVYPSLGIKAPREDYIITLPQTDEDTDLSAYGRVNYVLTVNPPQTHAENQRVLTEALKSFDSWTDIATAYEEVYDFSTNLGDKELKLYRRARDIPDYDYRNFMARCAER